MSSTERGKQAEKAAGAYLEKSGFRVHEYNWRTRRCEIDIVAEKNKTLYFVEVKYRASDRQGSGIEYVTSRKLEQMSFAAEMYVQTHNWAGQYQLAAIEVSGSDYVVTQLITEL